MDVERLEQIAVVDRHQLRIPREQLLHLRHREPDDLRLRQGLNGDGRRLPECKPAHGGRARLQTEAIGDLSSLRVQKNPRRMPDTKKTI